MIQIWMKARFALVMGITVAVHGCRGGANSGPTMTAVQPIPADAKAVAPGPDVLAVRAGHLVDPATGTSKPNQIILIRAGRIEAVGADVLVPEGTRIVDLSTSWVLPGLFDAHTHLCAEMSARWHVEEFLVYSLAESTPLRAIPAGMAVAPECLG